MPPVDTFELLPSLARGHLSEISAPELVAAVFRSRASGTLWLETPQRVEMRLFFRAGDMCGAGTFEGFQTLAHVLLANDWVNALDIESSREESVKMRKRHGEVLVQRGLLTADQLRAALAAQHTTNLLQLMQLTEGEYDWRGWEPPPPWSREVTVNPMSCLVDALELPRLAPRRQRVIQWLGEQPVRLSLEWAELQGRIALPSLDMRGATLLALPRRMSEFAQVSGLPPARAEALIAALLLAGAAEPQPAEEEGEVLEPEPFLEPIEEEASLELDTARTPSARPSGPPRRAHVGEDEALSRLDSLSLDRVASTAPGPPQVHDAELELDMERSPPPPAAEGEKVVAEPGTASDVERGREMRKKLVARGVRNLGTLPAPPQEKMEGGVEVAPPRAAPEPSAALCYEDQRFADEVRSRARLLQRQNAYERLGVAPGAATEPIKSAYLQLAKRFHPDRAAGPLASLQAELQALFGALKDAYESLATSPARATYDASRKGGKNDPRKEEAALILKMGEVLLKKRDFDGALNKLRRAVDLDATGDALAALAWALVSDPRSSPQAKEEAASLINRALRAPGPTARTYYVAGVLWRTKDPDSAVDAFRKALELDPHHSDAALELRLIEQRRGKTGSKSQGGSGVLSGLLFGKRKS